jgi:cyclohexyl-isocyanide hydratase
MAEVFPPVLKVGDPFRVAMLLFPRVTQLDLTGPYEVFTRVRGVEVLNVWKTRDPVVSATGLKMLPDCVFAECASADLLCIPGGPGHVELMDDPEVLSWVRKVAAQARWVTSVCTGSLVLGAAGLLRGYNATTHWGSLEALPLLGAQAVSERVVWDRNRVTGAGVTSGIDFALQLIERLWGTRAAQLAQLTLEYDPRPPLTSGSPATSPPEIVAHAREVMTPYREKVMAAAAAAAARWSALR